MLLPGSQVNAGYGSKHACTLFDIQASVAASAPQYKTSGHSYVPAPAPPGATAGCSSGQTYAQRCAVFQAGVPGYYFVSASDSSDGVERCYDFGGGYVSVVRACQEAPTGLTWDDSPGAGTPLVIQGQQAGGSNCTDAGGNAVGCNGGDVILRPGAASINGQEGSIKLRNSAGADVVSISGSTMQVQAGMTLGVSGTFESVGKYIAEPSSATVAIVNHGDAISGSQILNAGTGALEYAPITKEFIVLNCDDGSANMRDVINPVFPPGSNGQVVHVVNIGEDYCQMQRGGPSQAPSNAKFKTINNADRACLKSSADGGGIMTFIYYFANGVGGWQQMTAAPTVCD